MITNKIMFQINFAFFYAFSKYFLQINVQLMVNGISLFWSFSDIKNHDY